MKHTKGPWTALKVEDYYQVKAQPQFLRGFTDLIANVEGQSNAKLIAAAPDLLEACQSIFISMSQSANMSEAAKEHYKGAMDLCEAAIKKATGE